MFARSPHVVCNRSIQLVLGLALVSPFFAFSGCAPSQRIDRALMGLVSKKCTVFFRHDVLGKAGSVPSSFEANRVDGADVSVSGKFVSASDDWVIIESDSKRLYIPKSNVLFVSSSEK